MNENLKAFFSQAGTVLLNGVGAYVDGEAMQRYGVYRGQLVADEQGNVTAAGTPFASQTVGGMSVMQLLLIAGGVLVVAMLIKRA